MFRIWKNDSKVTFTCPFSPLYNVIFNEIHIQAIGILRLMTYKIHLPHIRDSLSQA